MRVSKASIRNPRSTAACISASSKAAAIPRRRKSGWTIILATSALCCWLAITGSISWTVPTTRPSMRATNSRLCAFSTRGAVRLSQNSDRIFVREWLAQTRCWPPPRPPAASSLGKMHRCLSRAESCPIHLSRSACCSLRRSLCLNRPRPYRRLGFRTTSLNGQ